MQINLVLGWLWILLGFGGGFILGLGFHRENWLGGYTSHRRRLYRLSHISFFGLALINLLFYFTAHGLHLAGPPTHWASWGFVIGAVSMPCCCLIMAHRPAWRALFLIPVISLILGGCLTFLEVIKL